MGSERKWGRQEVAATLYDGVPFVGAIDCLGETHVRLRELITDQPLTVPISALRSPTLEEVTTRAAAREEVDRLRAGLLGLSQIDWTADDD